MAREAGRTAEGGGGEGEGGGGEGGGGASGDGRGGGGQTVEAGRAIGGESRGDVGAIVKELMNSLIVT